MKELSESDLEYADLLLQQDPAVESDAIAWLRERRAPTVSEGAGRNPILQAQASMSRENARSALQALHEDRLTEDQTTWSERLEALDLDGDPDLAAWRDRLALFHELRPVWQEAHDDSKVSRRVLQGLAEIATASDDQAARLRTELLKKVGNKNASISAKALRKDFPELVDLDPDWIQRLKTVRRDRDLATQRFRLGGSFFIIWVAIRILRYIFGE